MNFSTIYTAKNIHQKVLNAVGFCHPPLRLDIYAKKWVFDKHHEYYIRGAVLAKLFMIISGCLSLLYLQQAPTTDQKVKAPVLILTTQSICMLLLIDYVVLFQHAEESSSYCNWCIGELSTVCHMDQKISKTLKNAGLLVYVLAGGFTMVTVGAVLFLVIADLDPFHLPSLMFMQMMPPQW